jgi:DNA-directed RNA polymerase subunit RPC12/RpoP
MSSPISDDTRRYWTGLLARPDALIIDGSLYFVGPEPTPADLAANPKLYGCYGTGFTIGHADGTETVTHNLGSCGAIPHDDLRPVDNAAFLGEPEKTPMPLPPAHQHFEHLDYIGGAYPYECVVCHRRFLATEVPAEIAAAVLDGLENSHDLRLCANCGTELGRLETGNFCTDCGALRHRRTYRGVR